MGHGAIPRAASVALAALTAASCNVLLGYDDGSLYPGPSSSPAGGSGGEGNSGGTTPSGGGGTGSGAGGAGGGGNAGGSGPTPCYLWPAGSEGCPVDQKCSVIDETTGETRCVPFGPRSAWARCSSDAECGQRLWCDHGTGVCKPLCQTSAECPPGAACLAASAAGGGTILGLQICAAHCDPRNPTSCNQSYGATNCLYGSWGFDCFWSGESFYPDSCQGFLECGPPHTCFGGSCRQWCDGALDCPLFVPICHDYSPAIYYDGTALGYCSAL